MPQYIPSILSPERARTLLSAIGLLGPQGQLNRADRRKHNQIVHLIGLAAEVLRRLPRDRELTFLDAGCGKSQLLFVLNHVVTEGLGLRARFVGLDVKAMREAAAAFIGLKDFRGFSANDPEETSPVVQVDRVEILEEPPLLLIRVVGSHFLWRMVRRMVGVLVAVGRRELKPADVPRMLVEASSESAALAAPASGLFLERVYYPGDDREGDTCRPRGQSGTRSGPSGCGIPPSASS